MKNTLKKAISAISASLLLAQPMAAAEFYGTNPIVQDKYTADPAPMVVGDTLYVYTSHDEDELIDGFYTMFEWCCYSTTDMVNWTDHGVVFSLEDIEWAEDRAWAPQAVERNGKYYLYCPVHKKNGGMAIAVGVSDSPTGPFVNIGEPLIDEGDWNDIDPTVFIDDDGQAYLYFGNPELRYVLLNEDMVSYDKEVGIVKVPMTQESFGKGGHATGTTYAEGPWFYKRGDIYYMVYAAFAEGAGSEHIAYSTSSSPTGPWEYQGVMMTEEGGTYTNHPGIVDFKGHSYLFYHTAQLQGGGLFNRSVCVAEFEYNDDGTIDTIAKPDGVKAISTFNPFNQVGANTYCYIEGIDKVVSDDGTYEFTKINDGNYIKMAAVNFGSGADTFTASVKPEIGGSIELRLDSVDGKLVGTLEVPAAAEGTEAEYTTLSTEVSGADGVHDLYIVFTSSSPRDAMNLQWWQFEGSGAADQEEPVSMTDSSSSDSKPNTAVIMAIAAVAAIVVAAIITIVVSSKKKKNKKAE